MTLSATDAIRRGLVNLRANWELILFQLLQTLVVMVLVLVGFIPPLAVLGFGELDLVDASVADWTSVMASAAGLVARGREAWVLLLASVVLSSAIWLMATLVYCYFQGGIFGVLMAGDRQAPPGKPRGWSWFRTFSARHLRGWAARYLWRYFWLLNLIVLIATLWLVIPFVLILLTMWGDARWGSSAALGIGCGGAIPVIFSVFLLAFWVNLAQADLAREESSVLQAARQGLLILGRRLGAVMILAVAGVIVSFSFTIAMAVAAVFVDIASGAALELGGHLALSLVEWVLGSVISMAFLSILVSLARSEAPQGVTA